MLTSGLPLLTGIRCSEKPQEQELLERGKALLLRIKEETRALFDLEERCQAAALSHTHNTSDTIVLLQQSCYKGALKELREARRELNGAIKFFPSAHLYEVEAVFFKVLDVIQEHKRKVEWANPIRNAASLAGRGVVVDANLDYKRIKDRVMSLQHEFVEVMEEMVICEKKAMWCKGRNIDVIYQEEVSRDAVFRKREYKNEWHDMEKIHRAYMKNFHGRDYCMQCIRKKAYELQQQADRLMACEEEVFAALLSSEPSDQGVHETFARELKEGKSSLQEAVEKFSVDNASLESSLDKLVGVVRGMYRQLYAPLEIQMPITLHILQNFERGADLIQSYFIRCKYFNDSARLSLDLEQRVRSSYFEKRARVNPSQMILHTSRVLDRARQLVARVAAGEETLLPKHLREIVDRVSVQVRALKTHVSAEEFQRLMLKYHFLKRNIVYLETESYK